MLEALESYRNLPKVIEGEGQARFCIRKCLAIITAAMNNLLSHCCVPGNILSSYFSFFCGTGV
jgi:hypothetical protein